MGERDVIGAIGSIGDQAVIKAAIVGCGNLGAVHASCMEQISGITPVAYCDVSEGRAEELLGRFGGAYATDRLDKVLQDESIDAVYIATLHDTHADYCVRALEAGKHVLVEKPLALNVEDCLRVAAAVEASGKKLMTAFKMRHYELLRKAKELIPQPLMIAMQMMDDRWPEGIWPNDPLKGGGNVLSQGCHSTDILRFMAGSDPIEVYALGGNYYQSTGVVDNMAALYRFEGGVAGNLLQGDSKCPSLPSKFFMQLYAEGKCVTLSDRLTTLIYDEAGQETQTFHGVESGFLDENKAFVQCIVEGTRPPTDHVDGLYATLMILQAMKSLQTGKPEPIRSLVQVRG